ncbi:polynucleotide adenylyltransferase PcnB [Breznakiella homolactica]|uniref:Polynucleotide adenylyltransferase PcnB n=1 Tax=Breznakiella homolactica TaxID=2798577 RepID=A0A7T7XKJ6_9SPIR|nr:polynucleotide adenylyltransferase PcnB [Breznakiella homolactica]QQO07943.1 polynucleotide adenylyltransferase PcnB [Breznakiella homolactica]
MRIRYTTGKNGRPVRKAVVYTRDEHHINLGDVDRDAISIVERLKSHGHETYIVGGAVRDLMLGKKPKDFDIVSDASPSKIKKLFRNSRVIGRRFRLVHVYFGPKIFEVSTFRSIKDGHTSNTFGTIEEDVLRRDFTINALFYDPGEQVVVDYVGAMKDFREKRIRPIIPLQVIFRDDPVRMIRAAKYAASTGFTIPLGVRWKIKKEAPLLAPVSPSRLTEEMNKIVHSPCAPAIVENLERLGLYTYLQSRASALMKDSQEFKTSYLNSLSAAAAGEQAGDGAVFSALIRDYLEDSVDWSNAGGEQYKEALAEARTFVLPMNPPRVELEKAVRLIFKEHGITVKRTRTPERGRGAAAQDRGGSPGTAAAGEDVPAKKRRRRRRRKTGPGVAAE